jgi:hypothetical protein
MAKKTILQLIEEHEDILKNTLGRRHQPLTEEQIRILIEVGCVLREDPEAGTFMGTLDWFRKEIGRERREKKWAEDERKRKTEKEREAEFQPKLMAWLKKNAKPGLYLKMKGCRDGSGYREIMEIDWEKERMTCYKLVLGRWPSQKFIRVQLTDHAFDKVLGTLRLATVEEVEASKRGYSVRVRYTSLRKVL